MVESALSGVMKHSERLRCDKLGLLVWQDMPGNPGGNVNDEAKLTW